jgi:hypothetical protein
MDRRKFLQRAGVGAASPFFNWEALAQGPTDRVLIVTEMTPNSLDTHRWVPTAARTASCG